jgi:hypothetical protein
VQIPSVRKAPALRVMFRRAIVDSLELAMTSEPCQ